MTVRRQWLLIGVAFLAACALVPIVPLFTGVDGRLVMSGGPAGAMDNRPVPHRTVLALDVTSHKVLAHAVTDGAGRFSLSLAPGPYLLEAPGIPFPDGSGGRPGAWPKPYSVGLFGRTRATLVILAR